MHVQRVVKVLWSYDLLINLFSFYYGHTYLIHLRFVVTLFLIVTRRRLVDDEACAGGLATLLLFLRRATRGPGLASSLILLVDLIRLRIRTNARWLRWRVPCRLDQLVVLKE